MRDNEVEHDVEVVMGKAVPAGHEAPSVQLPEQALELRPALAPNVPSGQSVQDPAPSSEKVPGGQGIHDDVPCGAQVPAEQLVHEAAPLNAMLPAGHVTHVELDVATVATEGRPGTALHAR